MCQESPPPMKNDTTTIVVWNCALFFPDSSSLHEEAERTKYGRFLTQPYLISILSDLPPGWENIRDGSEEYYIK